MLTTFYKYSANGNDFILFPTLPKRLSPKKVQLLCDRRIGIGADGILVLSLPPRSSKGPSFIMTYYNNDGGKASMCGNGLRSLAHYIYHHHYEHQKNDGGASAFTVQTDDGPYLIKIINNKIWTRLKEPTLIKKNPFIIDTGVPHLIVPLSSKKIFFAKNLMESHHALKLSLSSLKNQAINVNFVFIGHKNHEYLIRTFERGIFDETKSCGTGALAFFYYLKQNNLYPFTKVAIKALGGIFEFKQINKENFYTGNISCPFYGTTDLL